MAKKDKVDSKQNDELREEDLDLNENTCDCDQTNEADKNEGKEESCEEVVLKSDYDTLNNKMLRLQADFLNYKARTEKEKTSTYGNAIADCLTELLPILDNFERAIESDNSQNQEVINFKNGVKMIYDQFFNTLQKKGLKEIEALNAKFDPNIHSGIAFEVTEEHDEDTIIEVFQKGYCVNNKVIRPSMVKIAKK